MDRSLCRNTRGLMLWSAQAMVDPISRGKEPHNLAKNLPKGRGAAHFRHGKILTLNLRLTLFRASRFYDHFSR
jgi:hypothetical protein